MPSWSAISAFFSHISGGLFPLRMYLEDISGLISEHITASMPATNLPLGALGTEGILD
jgi:hypothetical protein